MIKRKKNDMKRTNNNNIEMHIPCRFSAMGLFSSVLIIGLFSLLNTVNQIIILQNKGIDINENNKERVLKEHESTKLPIEALVKCEKRKLEKLEVDRKVRRRNGDGVEDEDDCEILNQLKQDEVTHNLDESTDIDMEQSEKHELSKYKSAHLMRVNDTDLIENLHVHVLTAEKPDHPDCGGCTALWELYYAIKKHNISLSDRYYDGLCGNETFIQEQVHRNKTIVFVYPEVFDFTCEGPGNRVHVRWLLAPLGISVNETIVDKWGEDNLVFTYSFISKSETRLPLQVLKNPQEGDETDVSTEVFYNRTSRDGLMWMLRKGRPYKKMLDLSLVDKFGVKTLNNEVPTAKDFLHYEYFLTWDPFTFYSFTAAMLGTVSIVVPLPGVSKEDWVLSTFVADYIKIHGGTIPGIAYGLDKNEIDYARRTMPLLREFLVKVKAWGETTVSVFLRDSLRFGHGERNHFESALLVRDAYPKGKEAKVNKDHVGKLFAMANEHSVYGHNDEDQTSKQLPNLATE